MTAFHFNLFCEWACAQNRSWWGVGGVWGDKIVAVRVQKAGVGGSSGQGMSGGCHNILWGHKLWVRIAASIVISPLLPFLCVFVVSLVWFGFFPCISDTNKKPHKPYLNLFGLMWLHCYVSGLINSLCVFSSTNWPRSWTLPSSQASSAAKGKLTRSSDTVEAGVAPAIKKKQWAFQEETYNWTGKSLKVMSSPVLSDNILYVPLKKWPKWHKI